MSAQHTVDQLFAMQLEGYRRQPGRPLEERRRLLTRLKEMVIANADAIKQALALDFRKPQGEVELSEIGPVLGEVDFAMANLAQWTAPQVVPTPPVDLFATSESHITYEPKGVCLIISPWNYPVLLSLGPLASCLAAGNRAILKPSEHTPHAAVLLESMIGATFAAEDVAVVQGDARVAAQLLDKPFHHVFFTGGTAIGKIVMAHAATHLSSCTLELGGKSPVIVDETCDLALAAQKIAWGKTFNAGQTCIAPDYVIVHERVKDRLIEGINAVLDQLYGASDEALVDSDRYTAIVNDAHFQRLSAWIDEAVSRGAQVLRGNTKVAHKRLITPTVLTGVDDDAALMREEIFGPIIPITTYRDLGTVIADLNAKDKPLSLYLFSTDDAHIDEVLAQTTSGGACINDVVLHFFSPFLPFGGANASGIGRAHGFYGFREFCNEKAVLRSALRAPRSAAEIPA
jgi:aldehyde dehydrogenase (NAD+)